MSKLVLHECDSIHIELNDTLEVAIADLQHIKDEYITSDVKSHTIGHTLIGNVNFITIQTFRNETEEERTNRLLKEEKERQHQQKIQDTFDRMISYHKDDEYQVYLKLKDKYD